MKRLLFLATLLALGGCAQATKLIGANPQVTAGVAIAVEARTGLQCGQREKAGEESLSARRLRLEYERIGFDMALASMLSEAAMLGVKKARALTDSLCPALPAQASSGPD